MNAIKTISCLLVGTMLAGCASMDGAQGPRGPRLVGSGRTTESERYAEIGVEFSSLGDFAALVSPSRWKSPIATGGSLSWMNPVAWSDDAGRTGRILLGEAVIVGGVVVAVSAGGDSAPASSSYGESTPDSGSPAGAPPSVPSTPPR